VRREGPPTVAVAHSAAGAFDVEALRKAAEDEERKQRDEVQRQHAAEADEIVTIASLQAENGLLDELIVPGQLLDVCIDNGLDDITGEQRLERNVAVVATETLASVTAQQTKLNELLAEPIPSEEPAAKPEKVSDLEMIDKSLDEFDLMEKIKEETIRLSPIESPQIFSDAAPKAPGQALDIAASNMEISASDILSQDLATMRNKLVDSSASVSAAQPILELNAGDDLGAGADTDSFFKEAAAKAFGTGADEFVKGYSSLDDLIGRTGGLPTGEEKPQ
jgi:hypothetical protein